MALQNALVFNDGTGVDIAHPLWIAVPGKSQWNGLQPKLRDEVSLQYVPRSQHGYDNDLQYKRGSKRVLERSASAAKTGERNPVEPVLNGYLWRRARHEQNPSCWKWGITS
jgi:hypothetical protein